MCGITSAEDAAMVAEAGDIKIPRDYGAEPVRVFVNDDVKTILRASDALNLEYIQLHGSGSWLALPYLIQENRVIYVLHANVDGSLSNAIYDEECSLVDWVLVDSATGGSGKAFNWAQFKLPKIRSKRGWLLAGGINPNNVSKAISTLKHSYQNRTEPTRSVGSETRSPGHQTGPVHQSDRRCNGPVLTRFGPDDSFTAHSPLPPSVNLISLPLPPSLTVRHRPFLTAGTRLSCLLRNATPLCRAVAVFVRVGFFLHATWTSDRTCSAKAPIVVLVALSQIPR
ncbi:hypothetical protein PIB30_071092 [Stylosanthes scabra]|uniref:phosphoribosylanthranilate isomerase n=1 Tax=Stylosanthes scabra TaxID=79078 RepID=A0ABU6ZMA7_9FABA|nr:hypothetical protein [Stylosanthes scabra]